MTHLEERAESDQTLDRPRGDQSALTLAAVGNPWRASREILVLWVAADVISGISSIPSVFTTTLAGCLALILGLIVGIAAVCLQGWIIGRYVREFGWQRWAVRTILAAILGLIVALPIVLVFKRDFASGGPGEAIPNAALFFIPLFVLVAQWGMLRRYFKRAWWWVVVGMATTVVGFGIVRLSESVFGKNSWQVTGISILEDAVIAIPTALTLLYILGLPFPWSRRKLSTQ